MADNTSVLSILVQLGVIGQSDIQAANALLDETRQKQTSSVAVQQDVSLAIADTSKATRELGQEQEHATHKANEHLLTHRQIHQVLHLIGKTAGPEAAAALAAVGVASGMGIGVAILAVRELWEVFHHAKEEAKKLAEEAKKAGEESADHFIALSAAADKASTSFEQSGIAFEHSLDSIDEHANSAEKALSRIMAAWERMEVAHKRLSDARKAEDLAGAKTPEEKEDIEGRYKAHSRTDEVSGIEGRIRITQSELESAKRNMPGLEKATALARDAAQGGDDAMWDHSVAATRRHDIRMREEELKVAGEFLKKELSKPPGQQSDVAGLKADIERLTKEKADLEAKQRASEQELKDAEKKQSEALANIRRLEGDLPGLNDQLSMTKRVVGEESAIDRRVKLQGLGLKREPLANTLLNVIEGEEEVGAGHIMTQEQTKSVQALNTYLRQHGKTQAEINKLLHDMMDLHKSTIDKVHELSRLVPDLHQKLEQSNGH